MTYYIEKNLIQKKQVMDWVCTIRWATACAFYSIKWILLKNLPFGHLHLQYCSMLMLDEFTQSYESSSMKVQYYCPSVKCYNRLAPTKFWILSVSEFYSFPLIDHNQYIYRLWVFIFHVWSIVRDQSSENFFLWLFFFNQNHLKN